MYTQLDVKDGFRIKVKWMNVHTHTDTHVEKENEREVRTNRENKQENNKAASTQEAESKKNEREKEKERELQVHLAAGCRFQLSVSWLTSTSLGLVVVFCAITYLLACPSLRQEQVRMEKYRWFLSKGGFEEIHSMDTGRAEITWRMRKSWPHQWPLESFSLSLFLFLFQANSHSNSHSYSLTFSHSFSLSRTQLRGKSRDGGNWIEMVHANCHKGC